MVAILKTFSNDPPAYANHHLHTLYFTVIDFNDSNIVPLY